MAPCTSRPDHRRRARRWLAALVLTLAAGAVGWVLHTRRRGQQAIGGDPWATPVRPMPEEPVSVEEPMPEGSAVVDEPGAVDEPAVVDGPVVVEAAAQPGGGPYGEGSAATLPDGSAPEGHPIKGNANSMLYHPSTSPYYARTKAEVWFRDEESAEAAGFRRWDHKRRS